MCYQLCVFFLKALGLEWHSKILLRIEIAGTIINAYDTYTEWFKTEGTFPVDYFVGGLVTGGIAFQPSGALSGESSGEQFDDLIGRWMARYKKYGHAREDGVHKPLHARGRAHTRAYMSAHTHTHTHAHARMHTHTFRHRRRRAHIRALLEKLCRTSVRVRAYVCVYVCVCMLWVCVRVCVFVCVCTTFCASALSAFSTCHLCDLLRTTCMHSS